MLDLQAAQSPQYRERGVARYALDFTLAVAGHPDNVVDQVLLRDDLPPVGRIEPLIAAGIVSTTASWEGPPGIFHALSPFDLDVPIRRVWPRAASDHDWRLVVTVYDLIPDIFDDIYLVDPGTRRRYQARRQLIRSADHVMTLSRSVAEDVRLRLGVPAHRITVVGAACAPHFSPAADPAAAHTELAALLPEAAGRTIVYNGAVEPRKNLDRLMVAYARIPAEARAGTQLVIVCRLDPLQRNHLEHEARRLGVGEQVLLTGEVTDETLVALYRTADLAIFPSLAEGYGLPVAEAMACGAPVIASGNSAARELVAPEATFDPWDENAIAAAMAKALTDEDRRRRLVDWSAQPQTTWSDVASRAVAVYTELNAPPQASPDRRPTAGRPTTGARRSRPAVALVTPWPPAESGVANYSFSLAEHLRREVDLDVFVDGNDDGVGLVAGPEGVRLLAAESFPLFEAAKGGYDSVIVCIGNSQFHCGGLRLLRRREVPAVTLAHDVRLTGLYLHGSARGAVPEGFQTALVSMYGPDVAAVVEDGWVPPEAAERHGVLMAREVIGLSRRVIVTSHFAANLARLDARVADRGRVLVSTLAFPEAVHHNTVRDQLLIGSFGVVNAVKQPEILVGALALLRRDGHAVRLVFAGPVGQSERSEIEVLATRCGVEEAVELTGFLDADGYQKLLGRVALAVQLRARTNGEASAAVHDCVAHGVPTVVTSIGSARELPGFVEKVHPDVTPPDLARLLADLLSDPGRRGRMADAGQEFARRHDFGQAARELLELAGVRV